MSTEKEKDWEEDYEAYCEASELEYYFDGENKKSPEAYEQNLLCIASWYLKYHERPHSWEEVERNLEAGKNRGDAEYIYYYACYHYEPDDDMFLKLVEESANKGFAEAQVEMGWQLYHNHNGEHIVTPEALEWYRKAAAGGHSYGQWQCGDYFLECCLEKSSDKSEWVLSAGKTAEDLNTALEWVHKAIEGGVTSAMCRLGGIYDIGVAGVVEKDEAKAFEYYFKASECGDNNGSLACGIAYEEGRGVAKDYVRARYFYQKAYDVANDGVSFDEKASFRWGRLLYNAIGGVEDKSAGEFMMRDTVECAFARDWDDDDDLRLVLDSLNIKKIMLMDNGKEIYTYGLPDRRCD